jgi:hypothetical protein
MRVLYIEGVAIRGGPESCGGVREGVCEALTGAVRAGLLSREISVWGADALASVRKAISLAALFASRWWTLRGPGTWARIEISVRENREVP